MFISHAGPVVAHVLQAANRRPNVRESLPDIDVAEFWHQRKSESLQSASYKLPTYLAGKFCPHSGKWQFEKFRFLS
jgi:hypothetical protein